MTSLLDEINQEREQLGEEVRGIISSMLTHVPEHPLVIAVTSLGKRTYILKWNNDHERLQAFTAVNQDLAGRNAIAVVYSFVAAYHEHDNNCPAVPAQVIIAETHFSKEMHVMPDGSDSFMTEEFDDHPIILPKPD